MLDHSIVIWTTTPWTIPANKAINVLNLDPHADCREIDRRHSGNSFSYAMQEGWLANYAVLGLHQQYNSQSMLERLAEKDLMLLNMMM